MPEKSNIQSFLKREIVRARCRQVAVSSPVYIETEIQVPRQLLDKPWNGEDSRSVNVLTDGLFGQDGPKTDETVKQWRRDLLPLPWRDDSRSESKLRVSPLPRHSALQSMKEELKSLVMPDSEPESPRETSLLQRRKDKLIMDIEKLEVEERRHIKESRMVKEPAEDLPEPITLWEKKRLQWNVERVKKAKAGLEKPVCIFTNIVLLMLTRR